MGFYVHYADPGFPDEPWPGERRLGPFNTAAEALAQAVEDGAGGYGAALGIYDEAGSDKAADGGKGGKALHTAADIARKSETRRKDLASSAAAIAKEDRKALQARLPAGVTLEALEEAGLLVMPTGRQP